MNREIRRLALCAFTVGICASLLTGEPLPALIAAAALTIGLLARAFA